MIDAAAAAESSERLHVDIYRRCRKMISLVLPRASSKQYLELCVYPLGGSVENSGWNNMTDFFAEGNEEDRDRVNKQLPKGTDDSFDGSPKRFGQMKCLLSARTYDSVAAVGLAMCASYQVGGSTEGKAVFPGWHLFLSKASPETFVSMQKQNPAIRFGNLRHQ